MAKRKVKKKSSKKKQLKKSKNKKSILRTSKEIRIEKVLVENFVGLQKVMTNLSIKFDGLTDRIDKLLDLFEISAKSLAEKEYNLEKDNKDNEKILKNISGLYDQNKIIARGLSLLHEGEKPPLQKPQTQIPVPQPKQTQEMTKPESGQYQKSIFTNTQPQFKKIPKI